MVIPTKKLSNGFEIPVYGLGTWKMGGGRIKDTSKDEDDIQAIKRAMDLGVTHIDTAEGYAEGHAEELVGQAIQGYDRANLFIASKVSSDHLKYDDLIKAAKASLERLGTDYLDLYYIHSYNPEVSLEESFSALDSLVDKGLVRNIGVSNFSAERVKEAQSFSKYKIVVDQVHYNLKIREPERKGLIKYCQENDVMLVAWRPLRQGVLFDGDSQFLEDIAKKYGKTPVQVSLNWLISQKNVVTISKTNDIDHLKENLGAIGWEMEERDVEKLRNEYPDQEDLTDTAYPLQ